MIIEYLHSPNWDGTIESICPRCDASIGTSHWEADLDRMEAAHVCEGEQRKPVGSAQASGTKSRGQIAMLAG